MMIRKLSLAAALAATLLAGCGGGSSDNSSSSGGGGGSAGGGGGGGSTSSAVAGPLDTVQTSVASSVIGPLSVATAGSPLQPVLFCANSVVNQNLLDIADAFANGLANPATLASVTPAQAQATVTALVANLSGLLQSLAGNNGCSGSTGGIATLPTSNPLAGTPLAALGDALLPALTSATQQLQAGAGGASPLGAVQLASIVDMLATAYATGLGQLPPNVTGAPIVGGLLVTVGDSLSGLATLANDAAGGANPTVLAADLQALVQTTLTGLLTKLVPVGNLQGLAGGGASTDVLAQVQAAVAALTAQLGTTPTLPLPANPLGGSDFSSLFSVLSQLVTTLPGSLGGTAGSSPLAVALGAVTNLLGTLLAPITGGGGSGTCLLHFLGLC